MKVMTKTLVIFFITTLLFIGVTYSLAEFFVMGGFLQNEAAQVKEDMGKVAHAIDMEFDHMEEILVDWSAWDDTYRFIVDRNEEYINSNLVNETFINLDLNLMVFVNSSNAVIFGKAVDLYTGEEARIPDALLLEIGSSNSPLLMGSGTHGLILTEQGPMMVSSKPILKSNKEGPARGFLIFGRYFDENVLRRVESMVGFNLLVLPVKDSNSLSTGEVAVRPINESFVSGSYTMTDIHGQPALTIQGEIPRILYQQGRLSATQFLILFTSLYITLGVIAYLFLNISIFSRLKKLENHVKSVGKTSELGEKFSLAGDDELSSLSASINDMLERLDLAKKSLMESEKRFRSIFEGAGTALALVDTDMRIHQVNALFVKMFGYSKDEVEGKISFAEIVNEQDYSLFLSHQKKALEGESAPTFEARVKDKYGNTMFCLITISIAPETRELIVSLLDISKKKILEIEINELLKEMKRLDEIIDKSPAIAFMWRAEEGWPVEYVSGNVQQFGYILKDFVSGKIKYAEIIHPDDLERVKEEVMDYTRKGLEEFAQEYRIVTAGGDIRWVYNRTWLKRGEDGALTHYQGLVLDISERKWMEEQIKKYSEELERYSKHLEELVEERTKELREKERLAAIGQTAIMVGHDLRNPLQVMKNVLYILNDKVTSAGFDPKLKEEILERLKMMDRQIWYMNKIVLDLMDLSKERGTAPTLVNPRSILEELVEQAPSNIKVVIDLDQKMTAFLDEYIFRRVCSNLVLNAIQAMPNGGTLTISAYREGDYFVMKISDTGAGIPKEVLDKLFTPFFTTKAKGMGLGLAVSKKLVEAHGGSINVESEVGKGTTFTIKIPQVQ
jgi:PAS domain S-box-containing protein